MKRKIDAQLPSEQDEQRAVEELRLHLGDSEKSSVDLPATYWANMIVRTNQKIDSATSGKALSISWAARVAIPGVVALVFFFIGLHYYGPDLPVREGSVASLVNTLPAATVDSILVNPERLDANLSEENISGDIFQFSPDQISEYLVARGNVQTAVNAMSDSDMVALLAVLNKDDL